MVFVHDKDQRATAVKVKDKVQKLVTSGAIKGYSGQKVSTGVEDATTFYPAVGGGGKLNSFELWLERLLFSNS